MANDILKNIHDLNAKNLAVAGPATPPLAAGSPAGPSPDFDALLQEVQYRIAGRIRGQVDRTVARFAERLASIARESSTLLGIEDPLLKTQEIHYTDGEDPASPPPEELVEVIRSLESKVERLRRRVAGDRMARVVREALGPDLANIRAALENSAPNGQTPGSSDSDGGVERVLERLEELEERFSDRPPSDPAPMELPESLSERLAEIEAALNSPTRPPEFGEILAKLEELLALPRDEGGSEADVASEEYGLKLLERFADMEATLSQNWESAVERITDSAEKTPGSVATTLEPEMAPLLEEVRVLLESTLNSPAAEIPEASDGGIPEGLLESQAELSKKVDGLRKEFSLLVLTINSHLEQTQDLSEGVASTVRDTIMALRSGGGEDTANGAADRLETVLAELADLKVLPERIAAMLSAADEVNQYSLSSAVQEAVEGMMARMEQLLASG